MKFQLKPAENFQENRQKPIYWPILALFGTKNGLKIKKKLEAKKSKLYSHNFLCNIIVHIRTKYWKDQMKFEGVNSIWKTGWQTDGSASDKPRVIAWLPKIYQPEMVGDQFEVQDFSNNLQKTLFMLFKSILVSASFFISVPFAS